MSGISLDIAIPEYYGEYEKAMERLVELCQDETLIFSFFFKRQFNLPEITAYARMLYSLGAPDVAYSIYFHGRNDVDPVRDITKDLIFVCQHLTQFYRGIPFVQRLIDQANYLDKQITVVKIFPYGLTIAVI